MCMWGGGVGGGLVPIVVMSSTNSSLPNRNGIGNCECKSTFANIKGTFALPRLASYQIPHLLRPLCVEGISTIASGRRNVSSPPPIPSHCI